MTLKYVEGLICNNCMSIDEINKIITTNSEYLYFEHITEEKLPIVIAKFNINSSLLTNLNNIRLLIYKYRSKYPFGVIATTKSYKLVPPNT